MKLRIGKMRRGIGIALLAVVAGSAVIIARRVLRWDWDDDYDIAPLW